MPQRYKVRLTGPGINIERQVAEAIAQQVVLLTMGAEPSATGSETAKLPVGGGTAVRGVRRDVSVAEFLADSQASRGPDKVTAIGVFLRNHGGKATFSIPDLKKGFEDAAESVPGNLPRDINWAKKVGWIAPKAGQRGVYYVTATGMQAVTRKFPPDLLKNTKFGRRRKGRRRTTPKS